MNVLKLYVTAEQARSAFHRFMEYHKHLGVVNLREETFTYKECGTKITFGFAKDRDDCFRKYSGQRYQMIDFGSGIEEEVRLYMLTRLRGSTIGYRVQEET